MTIIDATLVTAGALALWAVLTISCLVGAYLDIGAARADISVTVRRSLTFVVAFAGATAIAATWVAVLPWLDRAN